MSTKRDAAIQLILQSVRSLRTDCSDVRAWLRFSFGLGQVLGAVERDKSSRLRESTKQLREIQKWAEKQVSATSFDLSSLEQHLEALRASLP